MKSKLTPKREAELRAELKTITKELKVLTKRFKDIKMDARQSLGDAKTSRALRSVRARLNTTK